MSAVRVSILTISDRSARGEREDLSGPALVQACQQKGWIISKVLIVSDEPAEIKRALIDLADSHTADLVLTTGGTGVAPRDNTPEATRAVIEKEVPGISEAIRSASLKITPHAMISRGISGIRQKTLIVNLPGSPKAAVESLDVFASIIPHAIDLLREDQRAESGHVINSTKG